MAEPYAVKTKPPAVAMLGSDGRCAAALRCRSWLWRAGGCWCRCCLRAPGLATSLVDDPAATQRERCDDRKDESDKRPVDRAPALLGPALDHFPGRHATSVPIGDVSWKGSGRMSHFPQNWAWTND